MKGIEMINEEGTESLKEDFSNYYGQDWKVFELENVLFYGPRSVFRSDLEPGQYAQIYGLVQDAKEQVLTTYLDGSMVVDHFEFKPNLIQKIVMKIFKIG